MNFNDYMLNIYQQGGIHFSEEFYHNYKLKLEEEADKLRILAIENFCEHYLSKETPFISYHANNKEKELPLNNITIDGNINYNVEINRELLNGQKGSKIEDRNLIDVLIRQPAFRLIPYNTYVSFVLFYTLQENAEKSNDNNKIKTIIESEKYFEEIKNFQNKLKFISEETRWFFKNYEDCTNQNKLDEINYDIKKILSIFREMKILIENSLRRNPVLIKLEIIYIFFIKHLYFLDFCKYFSTIYEEELKENLQFYTNEFKRWSERICECRLSMIKIS